MKRWADRHQGEPPVDLNYIAYKGLVEIYESYTLLTSEIAINMAAIDVESHGNKNGFLPKNLYTYVLTCGVYVPYYDWVYEDRFEYKGIIYYYADHSYGKFHAANSALEQAFE
jgi:hypothetical protein